MTTFTTNWRGFGSWEGNKYIVLGCDASVILIELKSEGKADEIFLTKKDGADEGNWLEILLGTFDGMDDRSLGKDDDK